MNGRILVLEEFKNYAQKLGYQKQTAIQEAAYPELKNHNSVLGLSPTGSGKTVAFTLPLLETIDLNLGTQVIVLEPTAELGIQTSKVMTTWGNLIGVSVQSMIGGANVKRQMEKLKKHPHIVVGTPGRILNLIELGKLKTDQISAIVVDEADNLLAGDTLDQVRTIVDKSNRDLSIDFFSATTNETLQNVNRWFIPDIKTIDVRAIDDTQGVVTHNVLIVDNLKKAAMLPRLIHDKNFKALVFFNQMNTLEKTFSFLKHRNIKEAAKLTSEQKQIDRSKAIKEFRTGKIRLLLTTDVTARGMDIDNLPAVVNYDLPKDEKTYIHRVGRTGRMGRSGQVINLGNDHDIRNLKKLLTDQDYTLTQVYFNGNVLSTTKPKPTVKPVSEAKDKTQTNSRGSKNTPVSKPTTKISKNEKSVNSKKSPKSKKKHSKRKGMRKKNSERN